jgi:hypothetical protein
MFLFIDLQIIQFFQTVTLKYLFFFEKRGTAALYYIPDTK